MATGAATNVIGIAFAFGRSGALFDNYFETVLYGLEPSSVRHLVSQAQTTVRTKFGNTAPRTEAELLQQTQDYIRQCTPAHLDFLVNSALQKSDIETLGPTSLPILDFHTGTDGKVYRLRGDGTVLDESNKEYPFGKGLPDGAGITVACDGKVTMNGKTINFATLGLANWEEACKAAGDKAADGGGAPAGSSTTSSLSNAATVAK